MSAPHNKWSNYENAGKQTLGGAKSVIQSEINPYSDDVNYTVGVASTCQEAAFSTSTQFTALAGASMESVFSPFQMSSQVTLWLPTFLNDGEAVCDKPFSDQVDPPVKQRARLEIYAKYLNPFKRPGDPCHANNGADVHYDGVVLFNGVANDNQNIPNLRGDGDDFPTALRPIALRGPLMLQGWGYDLHGKPIPNELDGEANARAGIFKGMSEGRTDKFLDGWTTKRTTWPVGPVDLKFDRDRKVWTVPSRYRMVVACASGDILNGENGIAEVDDLLPIFDANGDALANVKTIVVKNPTFGRKLCSGDCFYAVFDTKDCSYDVIPNPPRFSAFNTGCFDSDSCASGSTGCVTELSTRDFTIVASRHLQASEMLLSGLCPASTTCCPPPCKTTKALRLDVSIPVGNKDLPSNKTSAGIGVNEVCDWDSVWFSPESHSVGTFISDSGCKTLFISGHPKFMSAFNTGCLDSDNCATDATGCLTGMDNVIVAARHLVASYMDVPQCPSGGTGVSTIFSSGLKLDVEIPIAGKAKPSGDKITSSVCDWNELWFDPDTLPTYSFESDAGCKVLAVSGGTFLKDAASCGGSSAIPSCSGAKCVTFGTGLIATNDEPNAIIDVDLKIGLTGASSGRGASINHLGALLVGTGLELTSVGNCDYMITSSGNASGVKISDTTDCGISPTVSSCTPATCITAGTGLIVSAGGSAGDYTINSDIKVGVTGHGGARSGMNHLRGLRIGSGLELVSNGSCDYTLIATGTGGGGGGSSCTGNKQFTYVSSVCCSGSGIGVSYGTAYFVDGCFSGVVAELCGTGESP